MESIRSFNSVHNFLGSSDRGEDYLDGATRGPVGCGGPHDRGGYPKPAEEEHAAADRRDGGL